jgi:hypothetical protein
MGNNLLFLQEPVKLDGLHPCKTVEQKDSELDIIAPDNTKAEDIKAVSMVIVKTAFGATKHVVQEVSPVCDMCFFTSVDRIDLEFASFEPLNMCIGICMWNMNSKVAFSMYKSKPTDLASNLWRACRVSSKNFPPYMFHPNLIYCH